MQNYYKKSNNSSNSDSISKLQIEIRFCSAFILSELNKKISFLTFDLAEFLSVN